MIFLFRSKRLAVLAILPNVLPLMVAGAIMGYLGIKLRPSTAMAFSIALGIAVDDTIHFLAKYRQELLVNNWNIRKSVFSALNETGVSMFYTSVVLFFGFFIFVAILNEIVWRTQSEVFWVNFKVWGLLPISFVFAASQFPLINKYKINKK